MLWRGASGLLNLLQGRKGGCCRHVFSQKWSHGDKYQMNYFLGHSFSDPSAWCFLFCVRFFPDPNQILWGEVSSPGGTATSYKMPLF